MFESTILSLNNHQQAFSTQNIKLRKSGYTGENKNTFIINKGRVPP